MNTSPKAGVHRRRPPDPQLRGTPTCKVNLTFRRAKSGRNVLLAPAHWGLRNENFKVAARNEHRLAPSFRLGAPLIGNGSATTVIPVEAG